MYKRQGIGSQAKALKNLGIQINTLGTSEWDVHAIVAYDLIHNQNAVELPEEIQNMSKEELLNKLRKFTFSNSGKKMCIRDRCSKNLFAIIMSSKT